MSGQGVIYDTSPFSAKATRRALAESAITGRPCCGSPSGRGVRAVFTAELTHPPPPIWGMLLSLRWVLIGSAFSPADAGGAPNRTAPNHTSNIANADGAA